MSRRGNPPKQVDASGECRHLYLTSEGTCVHCGMRFHLVWTSNRAALLRPTTKNLMFAVGGAVLMAVSQATGQPGIFTSLLLVVAIFFFTRSLLGGAELYFRHGFVPGKLGPLVRRGRFNPLLPKPYVTTIGAVRFPIDLETYEQFSPGDTLLVEHLRWSRLPVAVYRGRL